MKETLKKNNASEEFIQWAGDKTVKQIWDTCERGDWMLELAKSLEFNEKLLKFSELACLTNILPVSQLNLGPDSEFNVESFCDIMLKFIKGQIDESEKNYHAALLQHQYYIVSKSNKELEDYFRYEPNVAELLEIKEESEAIQHKDYHIMKTIVGEVMLSLMFVMGHYLPKTSSEVINKIVDVACYIYQNAEELDFNENTHKDLMELSSEIVRSCITLKFTNGEWHGIINQSSFTES